MKRIGSEWVDELATLDDQESGWRPDPRVDLGSSPRRLSWWIQQYPSSV